MPRMLDLIRTSQVPSNLMQSAARGSLSVPSGEMIEILVYLSLHSRVFGQQARLTLAGWDEKACLVAAQDPATSAEVLGYWVSPDNLRIPLLRPLVGNPSVTDELLQELARTGARPVVDVLVVSPRVLNSPAVLKTLLSNALLRPNEISEIEAKMGVFGVDAAVAAGASPGEEEGPPDEVVETAISEYLKENAAAIEAEKDKPFRPVGEGDPVVAESANHPEAADQTANSQTPPRAVEEKKAPATAATAAAASATLAKKVAPVNPVERRDSTMQKIAKLDIKGRIALAMRGNKEERSILIRDSTKIISLAVLDSPKVSESEVEGFASQRNVLDAILRAIPMKRRFQKKYNILRNLVFNPRTPIDASLSLMKNLMAKDLKALIENKDVPEAVRKLAKRMHSQKIERSK
ncbi:MAG: hypothetical protein WBV36_11670 [Terriglobales bacterium]